MINKCIIFAIILIGQNLFFLQSSVFPQPIKSEATRLYQNKEYCKALETYEKSIKSNEAMDNYAYYYAAQSACQCGQQTEKAVDFYKKGFEIGIDWSRYDYFANDTLNSCFNQTADWKKYLAEMKIEKDNYEIKLKEYLADINDKTKKVNESLLTDKSFLDKLKSQNFKTLFSSIKNFNNYPKPPLTKRWVVYHYKVNDNLEVPYLVYIPQNYNPGQKTPLYIHLHGGVRRTNFSINDIELSKNEAPFFDQPIKQNAFIIYPFANKEFNWLLHQEAFETIINELRHVKSLYNIDDNHIYITGHSNGGSGAFWFALNMPTEITSFAGLNYNPASYLGNTNFSNLKNNYNFFGISGTEDNVFDFKTVNEVYETVKKQGGNWTNYSLKANHGLPYNKPSDIDFMYEILQKQQRNPFPKELQWEIDNAKNGRIFWLEISQLDLEKPEEVWQKPFEPTTAAIVPNTSKKFYINKSGAVTASIDKNIVKIKASRIKELVFYVVPELVDLNKPLKIYVNNKLLFNSKVKLDKNVLLDEFIKTKDRNLLIFNKIKLSVS